jgi:hypothetical protein
MIDGDEAARKERLEASDRWISDVHAQQIVEDLEAASNNSVKWPHLAANDRKVGEF